MNKLWILVSGILAVPLTGAAEPATVSRNGFVRVKPFTDSKVVVAVKTGQKVDIQKRQGSWYFVKVGAKTGYTPMLSVRRTQPAATATAGSLSSTATGRSSTGGVVSTTGVRGLNEETLQTAAYDENAVAAVEKNRVSDTEVAAFAQAGGVTPRVVGPLTDAQTEGGAE